MNSMGDMTDLPELANTNSNDNDVDMLHLKTFDFIAKHEKLIFEGMLADTYLKGVKYQSRFEFVFNRHDRWIGIYDHGAAETVWLKYYQTYHAPLEACYYYAFVGLESRQIAEIIAAKQKELERNENPMTHVYVSPSQLSQLSGSLNEPDYKYQMLKLADNQMNLLRNSIMNHDTESIAYYRLLKKIMGLWLTDQMAGYRQYFVNAIMLAFQLSAIYGNQISLIETVDALVREELAANIYHAENWLPVLMAMYNYTRTISDETLRHTFDTYLIQYLPQAFQPAQNE